ncbi:MAG: aspartate 1-decarboxylase [Acidobacteriota bacterium]
MRRFFLRAKIHGCIVTEASQDYVGSLTLDRDLLDAAGLCPFEQVDVYNISRGGRFRTYLIEGARGRGQVCVNGAAAHLARRGDRIIIAAYCQLEKAEMASHVPRLVFVDGENRPISLEEARRSRSRSGEGSRRVAQS